MKTIEIKIYEMCDEIDYWKERAKREENEAKYWRKEYNDLQSSSIKHSEKMMGNLLMMALEKESA